MSSARAIVLTTMEPSLHGWLMIMDVDDSYSSVCGGGGEGEGLHCLYPFIVGTQVAFMPWQL